MAQDLPLSTSPGLASLAQGPAHTLGPCLGSCSSAKALHPLR